MTERIIDDDITSYDPQSQAWTKRADAENLAKYLANELGLSPKAATVDKDGKTYRVYVPLFSAYWSPKSNSHTDWCNALTAMQEERKTWAA